MARMFRKYKNTGKFPALMGKSAISYAAGRILCMFFWKHLRTSKSKYFAYLCKFLSYTNRETCHINFLKLLESRYRPCCICQPFSGKVRLGCKGRVNRQILPNFSVITTKFCQNWRFDYFFYICSTPTNVACAKIAMTLVELEDGMMPNYRTELSQITEQN